MIFKTYNSETVARLFHNSYFCGSLFLGLVVLYRFISGAEMLSAVLSGFVFIVFSSLLSLNNVFRRSPFSILFCFFTFLYLNIPAAFILFKGSDYVFGEGLAFIPFSQSDYQQSLPLGFLYLSVFWIAMWLGIISANLIRPRRKISMKRFSSIRLIPIMLIGVIVLVVTEIDNQKFITSQLEGEGKEASLLPFIFFDHAYLILAGLILFYKISESKHSAKSKKITLLFFLISIGFLYISFIAGSKAAILIIFILLVFFPFCFSIEIPNSKVLFPDFKYLVMFALISLPLFYFALFRRFSVGIGIVPDFRTFLANIYAFDASVVYDIFNQIFYRFSQGAIDRYLLIFHSFVVNIFDPVTTNEFINYLAKNSLNLLLPGTPFPESYAPSSQLFPQVIQYKILCGDFVSIRSLNTQAYTIFGVFIIIFGLAAPVFLYLYTFVFIFMYNRINDIFIKIMMLYFFSGALSSYGIEVVLGNSVHLLVSILLMYFFIKFISLFHAQLPAILNGKRLPATTLNGVK